MQTNKSQKSDGNYILRWFDFTEQVLSEEKDNKRKGEKIVSEEENSKKRAKMEGTVMSIID